MNLAIEALITKRDKLILERNVATERFNQEISELETAMEQLSGKKVWEMSKEERYDDENPDYIKQSLEEI